MYTNYESWAEVKNIPYSIDSTQTQVKFVGSHGEYSAHDYQKKAVLAMHANRRYILKFQNAFVQLQQECNKLEENKNLFRNLLNFKIFILSKQIPSFF